MALLNVPVPEVVQVELVADPPSEPFKVALIPAQMVWSRLALTVAGVFTPIKAEPPAS